MSLTTKLRIDYPGKEVETELFGFECVITAETLALYYIISKRKVTTKIVVIQRLFRATSVVIICSIIVFIVILIEIMSNTVIITEYL